MDAFPSTIHGILNFEFQGELHIVLGDPEPYALCNATNFEECTMTYPRYDIEPLENNVLGASTKKQTQIIEARMGTYRIDNLDLFVSVKDLG